MVLVFIYGITEMNIEVYKLYFDDIYLFIKGQFKNGLRHGKGKWIKWIENNKLMD